MLGYVSDKKKRALDNHQTERSTIGTDWKNSPEQEGEIFVFRHYGLARQWSFVVTSYMGSKALYGYSPPLSTLKK